MTPDRCPAAHTQDDRECDGPPDAVEVIDRHHNRIPGCVRHAATLKAVLDSRAVIRVLNGGDDAATRCAAIAAGQPQAAYATITAAQRRDFHQSQTGARTELRTPVEVAALFRVDPKTVTRWAHQGHIPSVRTPGGHRRFYLADVEALLRTTTTGA